MNTHGWVMPNGKHKGIRITRVPVSYLKWMVNERHTYADEAAAEMQRRGTVTPDIEVSGHAIDRASLFCWKTWRENSSADEGLHAWLVRVAQEALSSGRRYPEVPGRILHAGLSFQFEMDGVWPVLKTVFPIKKRKHAA